MPSTAIHCAIDSALFGQSYPCIHLNKDDSIKHYGPLHRLIDHNPFYNLQTPFPPSAFAHDIADLVLLPLVPVAFVIDPRLVID